MFDTSDDVLEHFGVKGMKWGVRKPKKKLTMAQKAARTERRVKIAGRAIQVAGAAIFIASFMNATGSTRTRDIPPRFSSSSRSRTTRSVSDLINQERATQLSSLRGHRDQGFIDDAQFATFKAALNRRYDRRIAEAVTS